MSAGAGDVDVGANLVTPIDRRGLGPAIARVLAGQRDPAGMLAAWRKS
jgi:hypothetical protein